MKNKITGLIFFIALLTFGSAFSASISIDMIQGGGIDGSRIIPSNTSFGVDIIVDDVTDLQGFQFSINYDSSLVSASSINSGNIFGGDTLEVNNTITAGSASLTEASILASVDIVTPTIIATILFDSIVAGMGSMNLAIAVLSDSSYLEIPVTINNASITVPAPATIWLLLGFIGLLRSTHKCFQ